MREGAASFSLLTLAFLAIVLAFARREPEIVATLPRHRDPAICHAGWCATTRTGQQDDCDCGTDWRAA